MDNPSLTEELGRWLVDWRRQGLPPDSVLATAQGYVRDWLGSALAGGVTEPGQKLLDYARQQPAGVGRVIGAPLAVAAETAALINGGLSHIVEMDDLDRGSVVHPGAAVIPAALAVAQREQASGRDFLAAVVAGYEVAIRIGEAVGKQHYYYFHNTATCGVFGAAAAAGWILGLDVEQFVWALGNAGTQAAGLWQFNAEGDMSKHLHAGRAAAGGVLAADLAARGFTGARHILEGERGFFAATAPDANPEKVVAGLENSPPQFKIAGVSIKPYASCRHTHPAIDAALALRPRLHGRSPTHIQLDAYQAALDLCDNPDPQTSYAAKFSLHYCVASALVRGHVGLEDFSLEAIQETAVRQLLPLFTTSVDPGFEAAYPVQWPVRLCVTLDDDAVLETAVTHPKGDPENPLTQQELEAKFRQLAAYGRHANKADAWLDWVIGLASDEILKLDL